MFIRTVPTFRIPRLANQIARLMPDRPAGEFLHGPDRVPGYTFVGREDIAEIVDPLEVWKRDRPVEDE